MVFHVTQEAAGQLGRARAGRGLPDTVAVRVFGEPHPSGLALGLAFTEIPAEDDSVFSESGTRFFVGVEVAEALTEAVLDVEETVEGPKLVLIQPGTEEPI